jgi:hypothetical protein
MDAAKGCAQVWTGRVRVHEALAEGKYWKASPFVDARYCQLLAGGGGLFGFGFG